MRLWDRVALLNEREIYHLNITLLIVQLPCAHYSASSRGKIQPFWEQKSPADSSHAHLKVPYTTGWLHYLVHRLSACNLYGQVEDGRQSLEDFKIVSEPSLSQREIITLHPTDPEYSVPGNISVRMESQAATWLFADCFHQKALNQKV